MLYAYNFLIPLTWKRRKNIIVLLFEYITLLKILLRSQFVKPMYMVTFLI